VALETPIQMVNCNTGFYSNSMVKVVEKVAMPSVRDMVLMGKKYDGPEALKAGYEF